MRATKVNAGLAESNGRLLLGIWRDSLHVIRGLTVCTPGSAPGPTLGNEYGKTLPFNITAAALYSVDVICAVDTQLGYGSIQTTTVCAFCNNSTMLHGCVTQCFSKFRVWSKVPEGSTLIFDGT